MNTGTAFFAPLHDSARLNPDHPFLVEDSRRLSYANAWAAIERIAAHLLHRGLRPGDRCILFMANGIDYALAWLAMARVGIVSVPLNQAYRGPILAHQARDVAAQALFADTRHYEQLSDAAPELACLQTVFHVGSDSAGALPASAVDTSREDLPGPDTPWPEAHDILSIFYTSGTTGPSKGVLYTHQQASLTAASISRHLDRSDIFYMVNPMCHVGLPHCLGAVIQTGATLIVRERFSVRAFWPDVRRHGATATMMLGSVASFLNAAPADPDDGRHTLRKVLMVPVLADAAAFCERFNVSVMSWFNMTEVSVPLDTHGFSRRPNGSCGRPRAGAHARLVDEWDREVPPGAPGELIVRDDTPWALSPGYLNQPEATLRSWRNLWFHTGDLCMRDEAGDIYFIDRLKDCIRRRGENVSSHEVETQILSHPDVLEAAVIGVTADVGEQEIQAVVVLKPGAALSLAELLDFLQPRLPHFCLPRFVDFSSDPLPKTETGKIKKNVLRKSYKHGRGDREAIGYEVRR